jgi:hypothetical protein
MAGFGLHFLGRVAQVSVMKPDSKIGKLKAVHVSVMGDR